MSALVTVGKAIVSSARSYRAIKRSSVMHVGSNRFGHQPTTTKGTQQ